MAHASTSGARNFQSLPTVTGSSSYRATDRQSPWRCRDGLGPTTDAPKKRPPNPHDIIAFFANTKDRIFEVCAPLYAQGLSIPKHTHKKSETHIILGGSHLFESGGKRYDVKENGYIYMPGEFVHEAWVPAGAKAVIILEDGWKVDWLKSGPTKLDLGTVPPPF